MFLLGRQLPNGGVDRGGASNDLFDDVVSGQFSETHRWYKRRTAVGILNCWGHKFQLAKRALTFLRKHAACQRANVGIRQFDRIASVQYRAMMFFLVGVEAVSPVPPDAVVKRCMDGQFFTDAVEQPAANTESNDWFRADIFDTQRHVF